ncbi:MAG TPA: nucleotidyl transferase AbiEii/AbiGii toxin family protein [Jatrophihabitans sp.]|jgi:predicted nucleotidyltransferase component of viral defense system
MNYGSPQALRTALEHRLFTTSRETGIALDRLRRRVLFERIVTRLQFAEPGLWVLKGGMALEVRLSDAARLTKDIDVGLRDVILDAADLHERLIDALSGDSFEDRFVLEVSEPAALREDGGGHLTWRVSVAATLAGKHFGAIKLDVSPRAHELHATDRLPLPNSLAFAGISTTDVEIIDVHRHAAEKFHAMTRDFGDRENSRVRDLLDLVILIENDQLSPGPVADSAREVWAERDGADPPRQLPPLPVSWPARYVLLAGGYDVEARTLPASSLTRAEPVAPDVPEREEAIVAAQRKTSGASSSQAKLGAVTKPVLRTPLTTRATAL